MPETNASRIAEDADGGRAGRDPEVERLRDVSPQQWRSGIAAWLGWTFDGLELHLYTLVAAPFVAELLKVDARDDAVGYYSSLIQGAFLLGWALGGGLFGWIGDRLGRSRTLVLTILTYALFTGGSYFAATWWHLLIFRFLAALGIGGEWAVGAALLSETWPRRWRPWIAAVLQTGVNLGIIAAMIVGHILSNLPYRAVFLVGILPALIVVWIRRAVPEPQEWCEARSRRQARQPRHIGPLPRQDPANHRLDDPGLRVLALGPLGLPVLVSRNICGICPTWPPGPVRRGPALPAKP